MTTRIDPVGLAFVVLATLGFGLAPSIALWTVETGVSPTGAGFWRFVGPALVLIPALVQTLRTVPPTVRWQLLAAGVVNGVGVAQFYEALAALPVSLALVIFYSYPAVTLLIGWRAFGEGIGPRRLIAVALIVAGVAVATGGGMDTDQWGVALRAMISPLAFGFLLNVLGHTATHASTRGQASVVTWGCLLGLAPLAAATPAGLIPQVAVGWAWIVGGGIVTMLAPALLLTAGIRRIGASVAGIVSSTEFVVALVAGTIFFGDRMTAEIAVGAGLVLAAAVIVAVRGRG